MIENPALLHYLTIAAAVAIVGLGVGIGQGMTSKAALQALDEQPESRSEIMKIIILALALIETGAIIGSFVAVLMLQQSHESFHSVYGLYAQLGILFALCISGPLLSILSGY